MPRKRQKMQPMKYPVGIEHSYRRILLDLNNKLKVIVKQEMAPKVPKMVLEASDIHALPTGEVRQDAWDDELRKILERIHKRMKAPTQEAIKRMLPIGVKVNEFNREEWRKLVHSQFGVDPTAENPGRWDALLRKWSETNALLIKDIPTKAVRQIADETVDALRSGKPAREMADDVFEIMQDRTDVSESRANLIARDQIAKLNGEFVKERQADLGVESYVWRTVGDERVRPTHEECDGRVFSWDKPPIETDGNHPGEDYQCRCYAEPILPEMVMFRAELLEEAA